MGRKINLSSLNSERVIYLKTLIITNQPIFTPSLVAISLVIRCFNWYFDVSLRHSRKRTLVMLASF
jgi:hypothetical protein